MARVTKNDMVIVNERAACIIKQAITDKRRNATELSTTIGKSKNYISNALKNGTMEKSPYLFMCSILELDPDLILKMPAEMQAQASEFDFHQFEKRMLISAMTAIHGDKKDTLDVLLKRIDILRDHVESLENRLILQAKVIEKQNGLLEQALAMKGTGVDRLQHERAVSFLKEKMQKGYAEESEVYRDADELGIARMDIADARKELGIITSFKGYGKNAHSILIYEEKEA